MYRYMQWHLIILRLYKVSGQILTYRLLPGSLFGMILLMIILLKGQLANSDCVPENSSPSSHLVFTS